MKSIILASILSLGITFGGYIGVVKFTANRHGGKMSQSAGFLEEDLAAAELQIQGADEQKAMVIGLQGTMVTMQTNVDIARNVLVEEQRKLESLRQSLEQSEVVFEEQNEKMLRKLAKLYESMKPKEAAGIAEQLDTDLVVEIIPRMKERSAAKMLSAMDTSKAVEITNLIAARKTAFSGN